MELDGALALVAMRDAETFTSLKVVARRAEHVWVSREELIRLAGEHARDTEWQARLDGMLAYAASHGWVNDKGAVRVHVEWM